LQPKHRSTFSIQFLHTVFLVRSQFLLLKIQLTFLHLQHKALSQISHIISEHPTQTELLHDAHLFFSYPHFSHLPRLFSNFLTLMFPFIFINNDQMHNFYSNFFLKK
jgi:hypothetical protein